jgi:hydroxymethylglutaryl-CoA lyase
MNFPAKVRIREVAPRDGFQSFEQFLPTRTKLEVIQAIARSGIRDIELTSFVSPKAVPQLSDGAELIGMVPRQGLILSALVANIVGAKNALAAGVDELVVVISATEEHNRANLRRNIGESVAELDEIFRVARGKGVRVNGAIAVSFGCPYQGEVSETDVFRLAEAYASRGAIRVIMADTTGMAVPPQVAAMVRRFQREFPGLELGLHLHNNRGTAMTNLYVGLVSGVCTFDTALGGIGGCPYVPRAAGNLATEDVVYMLEQLGVETGIDLMTVIRAAVAMEKILGYQLPGQVMKSGPRDPRLAAAVTGSGPCSGKKPRQSPP